jgi:hypothetical protein
LWHFLMISKGALTLLSEGAPAFTDLNENSQLCSNNWNKNGHSPCFGCHAFGGHLFGVLEFVGSFPPS